MSIEDIKKQLHDDWTGVPGFDLCLQIVNFIQETDPAELQMLTFRSFLNALNLQEVNRDLITALNILVSTNIAALDAKALFVDDNDDEYELSSEDFEQASATDELVHPDTGNIVVGARSKIIPFFVPSERLTR